MLIIVSGMMASLGLVAALNGVRILWTTRHLKKTQSTFWDKVDADEERNPGYTNFIL